VLRTKDAHIVGYSALATVGEIQADRGVRTVTEHDKGPQRPSKTPALFPLPQKRCGYYSVIEPGQSEESGPPTVGVVGAPTYERSRCAKHGEYDSAFRGVPAPPGMGMIAPPEVPRNAEGAQSEGRVE